MYLKASERQALTNENAVHPSRDNQTSKLQLTSEFADRLLLVDVQLAFTKTSCLFEDLFFAYQRVPWFSLLLRTFEARV